MTKLEPFVKPNIRYGGPSPVQKNQLFPKGLHILMDDNRKNKRWMFFVCPMEEENTKQLVGNHFTFCVGNNGCHFHSTFYIMPREIGKWKEAREPDHFPLRLSLPRTGSTMIDTRIPCLIS